MDFHLAVAARVITIASAATLLIAGVGFAGRGTTYPTQTIYVRDVSHLSSAQVLDRLSAYQDAAAQDFAPVWGVSARLVFIGTRRAPAGAEHIDIVDFPSCLGCAGYHALKGDVPYGIVSTLGDVNITFTHELFEMLADPYVNRGYEANGKTFVAESADPVEGDQFSYVRKSRSGEDVRISDFITPAWFRPGSSGPYDFRGYVKNPLQVLTDGYQLVWENGTLTERNSN